MCSRQPRVPWSCHAIFSTACTEQQGGGIIAWVSPGKLWASLGDLIFGILWYCAPSLGQLRSFLCSHARYDTSSVTRQICLWQSLTKTSTHTISSTSITSNQQHMSKNLTFCIVSTCLSKSVGTVLVTFLESLLRRCVLKPSGALVSSVISGAASQIVEKGKKEHTDMCTVCI